MIQVRIIPIVTLIASFVLSAGIVPAMEVSSRMPDISIQHAEAIRSPVMIGVVSVFMDIANNGNNDDELTAVRTSIPEAVAMLHDVKDGRMVMIDRISVPAGAMTTLKPGSLHIMIVKMPKGMKEGDVFDLHLTFTKSGERQVPVKVVKMQFRR